MNLSRVVTKQCQDRESNPRPLDREFDVLRLHHTPPAYRLVAVLCTYKSGLRAGTRAVVGGSICVGSP